MHSNREIKTFAIENEAKIYKWLVLISMSLNSVTNTFLYTAFTPIWSFVAIYYNTTDYNLNWFTNCYFIGPIVFAFIINPLILKNFGVSQIFSCCLTTVGLWLLVLVGQDFEKGLAAFFLIGFGEGTYYQVPLYLSKLWFEPQERVLSTFIGQYASNLGELLGYVISAFYFNGVVDQLEFNANFEKMVKINAIFATVALVSNFTILKKPDLTKEKIEIRDPIWISIYKICTNQEGLLDLLSVSSFIGLSWCYPMLFSMQQYALGQTYYDVSAVNIFFFAGQLIAAGICTWQLQKQSNQGLQQEYDKYIKFTLGIGFLFLVVELLFFELMNVPILVIFNFVIGAGLGGIYSVLLESLMEKHFPVQELAIGSLLAAVACAESFIITMITIVPQILSYGFQISCFLMIPSFCYIIVFYSTSFKRFEFEA